MLTLLKFDQSHSGVDKKSYVNKNPDSRLRGNDLFGNNFSRAKEDSAGVERKSKSLRAKAMSPHKPKLSWNNIVQILRSAQDDNQETEAKGTYAQRRVSNNLTALIRGLISFVLTLLNLTKKFPTQDDSATNSSFVISTGGRNLKNRPRGNPLDFSVSLPKAFGTGSFEMTTISPIPINPSSSHNNSIKSH